MYRLANMTTPLIDLARFPGRRWANATAQRLGPRLMAQARLEMVVRVRWARHLRVPPDEMLLFATAEEAARAAVQALATPADVVLLAQPLPYRWVGAVLHSGARYVDVGRRFDGPLPTGGWNRSAAERAASAHPTAVAVVESPAWGGTDDAATAADLPLRALIVDATRSAQCLGLELARQRAALTLVALRDPDHPTEPVVYALVGPDGEELALRVGVGPTGLPNVVAEHALAVLDGLLLLPAWPAAMAARADARFAEWLAALAGRPGVVALGRSGLEAAALCLGDDAEQVARALLPTFASVQAWPMTPMRALLTVDLLG